MVGISGFGLTVLNLSDTNLMVGRMTFMVIAKFQFQLFSVLVNIFYFMNKIADLYIGVGAVRIDQNSLSTI